MANSWFRLYSEFASDPKVQTLPFEDQRHLVILFCLRCNESLGRLSDPEMAYALRITEADLGALKLSFRSKGFIDDKWNLCNWNKRQFLSDSSTERTRKWREKKQGETSPKRHGDATVTAPDTDTEQIQNRTEQKKPLASAANAAPASKGKLLGTLPLNDGTDYEVYEAEVLELVPLYPAVDVHQELRSMKGWLIGDPSVRKTRRGIKRFITGWLDREQDKAKPHHHGANGNGTHRQNQPRYETEFQRIQRELKEQIALAEAEEQAGSTGRSPGSQAPFG